MAGETIWDLILLNSPGGKLPLVYSPQIPLITRVQCCTDSFPWPGILSPALIILTEGRLIWWKKSELCQVHWSSVMNWQAQEFSEKGYYRGLWFSINFCYFSVLWLMCYPWDCCNLIEAFSSSLIICLYSSIIIVTIILIISC